VGPWGGAGKGVMCQPDENDLVLFLYFDADPTQGMVLGSLYGMETPPADWKRSGGQQCYTFLTPGGQKIHLNDSDDIVRIENKPGSYVEFSPKRMTVHATSDLHIEAPGQAVVIRGKSIDFEQARHATYHRRRHAHLPARHGQGPGSAVAGFLHDQRTAHPGCDRPGSELH